MKKHLITLAVLACVQVAAIGQSADLVDRILAEDQVSFGSAAYLVLGAAQLIPDTIEPAEAFEALNELGIARSNDESTDPISLGEYARLIMIVFEIEGGLLYSLAGSPRHAVRELSFLNVVQGRSFPGMTISGERAIRILNRTIELREEGRI